MGVYYACIIIQISQSRCYVAAVFSANNSAMKVCFIKHKYMKGNLPGVSSYKCLCHIMQLCYHNLILDKNTPNVVKELFFYKISHSVFCLLFSIISYAIFLWTCFIFHMFIYEFLFFTLNVSLQFKQSKTEYLQQNFPRSLCISKLSSIHTRLNRWWECLTQVWETVFFRIVEKIIQGWQSPNKLLTM